MKITYQCLSCLTKQIVKVAIMSTNDRDLQHKILKKLFTELSQITYDESSPYIAWKINKYINNELNIADPYKKIKDDCNQLAFRICDDLKLNELIENSDNKIETACRLAIAGNIIDFSAHDYIGEETIKKTIQNCLTDNLYGNKLDELIDMANRSKTILYLADNSGEIVFDKFFVNQLPKEKISFVVKSGPIVNDALYNDTVDVGMDKLVNIIETGSDSQGIILDQCSDKFKQAFEETDLIIAKGQANFETLNYRKDKNIFYLFKAKCEPVAKHVGCNVGDLVMTRF